MADWGKTLRMAAAACLAAWASLAAPLPSSADALSGETIFVVVPKDAGGAVATAAGELCAYLPRACGRPAAVVAEGEVPAGRCAVYLGDTSFAAAHGFDFGRFADEEWTFEEVEGSLVIGGGGRRGTLYGAYHFLEDAMGVHWFAPGVDFVPAGVVRTLQKGLRARGRPAMRYRDIYFVSGPDATAFLARNRMNTESAAYGGRMRYSRAATNHSLYRYLGSPAEVRALFASHPDWFPLIDGERRLDKRANSASKTQLCLANPGLRQHFTDCVRRHIAADRAAAAKAGIEPPMFYAIDQNDCYDGFCRCPDCSAVIAREGGTAGLLLEFANRVAEALEGDAPDATFQMMAYFSTEKPPRHVRPRRNVGIRLCDSSSDLTRSWGDAANSWMRGNLEAWSRISDKIAVWDYQITFGWATCVSYPTPNERTFAPDLRMLAAHGGDGVFFEHEEPIGADMRDMKVWLEMKLVEDPSLDAEKLIETFTDGYYGAAGRHIRRYRGILAEAAVKRDARICWFPSVSAYDFIDGETMSAAESALDAAVGAVAADAELSARVDHARLSLDKLRIIRGDRSAVGRYRATWEREKARRFTKRNEKSSGYSKNVDKFLRCAELFNAPPTPEFFAGVPGGRLRVLHAGRGTFDGSFMQSVEDGGSAMGEAVRFVFSAAKDRKPSIAALFDWPFRCAVKDRAGMRQVFVADDALGEAPRGYHWFKIAAGARLSADSELEMFGCYRMPVGALLADWLRGGAACDVYASIRILGPDVIRSRAASRDNIYLLDQMAVVKTERQDVDIKKGEAR